MHEFVNAFFTQHHLTSEPNFQIGWNPGSKSFTTWKIQKSLLENTKIMRSLMFLVNFLWNTNFREGFSTQILGQKKMNFSKFIIIFLQIFSFVLSSFVFSQVLIIWLIVLLIIHVTNSHTLFPIHKHITISLILSNLMVIIALSKKIAL